MKKDVQLRSEVLNKVLANQMTLHEAAQTLELSSRQVRRLLKTFLAEGDKGLISKKIGAPSNHQLPPKVKEQVLELLMKHYQNLSPTFAHKQLTEVHTLDVSLSTVRNLMIEKGLWNPRKNLRRREPAAV